MAENKAVSNASELNLETAELLDIEFPIQPETDWSAVLTLLGWSLSALFVILIVWLVFKKSKTNQRVTLLAPLWLHWQFKQQLKSLSTRGTMEQQLATESELFSHYQLIKQLLQLLTTQGATKSLQAAKERLKQAELWAFSNQKTELQQLIDAYTLSQNLLNESIQWKRFFSTFLADFFGKVTTRRKR